MLNNIWSRHSLFFFRQTDQRGIINGFLSLFCSRIMTIDYRNFKFKEASAVDTGPTMGQFLHFVDSNKSWSEEEKKSYVLEHLVQTALRWSKANIKRPEQLDWTDIKRTPIERFYVKLNIRQKVQLRRELSQR